MDFGIAGKTALVMGGSRGLGAAVAEGLIAEGVKVAICARDAVRLSETAARIGATAFPCDLSQDGAAAKLVADVHAQLGGPDIMLVNTGGPPPRVFDTATDAEWRAAYDSLFLSMVQSIRAALPHMRGNKWGRIMVVTSLAAREPLPNMILSNSLRAGVHGFVNTLSREIAADSITINALMPGFTLTERLVESGFAEEKVAHLIPAGRAGRPEEFASLATYLSSQLAAYITGQAISIDGGALHGI